jgi:hypothetical protein
MISLKQDIVKNTLLGNCFHYVTGNDVEWEVFDSTFQFLLANDQLEGIRNQCIDQMPR